MDPTSLEEESQLRLTRFFEFYNPSCLKNLDTILDAYSGDTEKLFQDLCVQYGPEPVVGTDGSLHARRPGGDKVNGVANSCWGNPHQSLHTPSSFNGSAYNIHPTDSYTTRQVKVVSRGVYSGGDQGAINTVAAELVHVASINARRHTVERGPASVDEVDWWRKEERLRAGGHVDRNAFSTHHKKRPASVADPASHPSQFVASEPLVPKDSFMHWGKESQAFQSPAPYRAPPKTGPAEDEDEERRRRLFEKQFTHDEQLVDVICVKCGGMAKMNRFGQVVTSCEDSGGSGTFISPPATTAPSPVALPTRSQEYEEHPSFYRRRDDEPVPAPPLAENNTSEGGVRPAAPTGEHTAIPTDEHPGEGSGLAK